MTNIYIKANGATLSVNCDGKITSGTVGLPVTIEYNDEWRGLLKNISFRSGGIVRVRKNVANETTVPWEILRKSGIPLEIGIEGRNENGSIVFHTVWCSAGRILEGASGKIPAAPNPNSSEDIGGNSSINDDIISKSFVWSSKNTVDKLCPSFEESGAAVVCEPVNGYPLGIVSQYSGEEEPGLLTLKHTGKNLASTDILVRASGITENNGVFSGSVNSFSESTRNIGFVPAEVFEEGQQYVFSLYAKKGTKESTPYTVIKYTDGTQSGANITATGDFERYISVSNPGKTVQGVWISYGSGGTDTLYIKDVQVEKGSTVTPYEPYNCQTYTVDLTSSLYGGDSVYDWETGILHNVADGRWFQEDLATGEFLDIGFDEDMSEYLVKKIRNILAGPGVNCLYSYTDKAENTCTTTVSGKADPNAVIKDLYNKLNDLSATMTALTGV